MISFFRIVTPFLFLSFSVSGNVFAGTNMGAHENQTMFEMVLDYFNGGDILDLEKFSEKVSSGRCFHFETPETPVAAYLVVTKKLGDVGPLGAESVHYVGMMQEIAKVPPGYFDAVNIGMKDKHIYPTRIPFKLKYSDTYVLNYSATGETAYFRQNNNYIFSIVKDRFGQAGMDCYFFKTSGKTMSDSMTSAEEAASAKHLN